MVRFTKQKWADGATKNCVWIIQRKLPIDGVENWHSEGVCLTKKEALDMIETRSYYYGKIGEDCRIWGVPAYGMMVEILGKHNKEFESEVEYIS